jgi:NAD(P)-dependent dehydrogenase (short-subunit alcohol dehydrogenase family)
MTAMTPSSAESQSASQPLAGRIALVTGAGAGLGRAYAHRLAREGATVAVNDLDAVKAEKVALELESAGWQAAAMPGDVADWQVAEELVAGTISRFGDLHVLVNNAGNLRETAIPHIKEAEWDGVIRVHLKGHAAMLHWASRYWRGRVKDGHTVRANVINTTSNSGLLGQPFHAAYGAAKAGVAMLTVIAALELARYGVRVNSISPAARTPMSDSVELLKVFMRKPAAGFDRWDPNNVAALVGYLAEADCDLTGQCWYVSGGRIQRIAPFSFAEKIETDRPWTLGSVRDALAELPQTVWKEPIEFVK